MFNKKSYLFLFTLFILSIVLIPSICFSQKSKKKEKKQEINGEVFVVTKSAGNIKLGLVTVYFLTEKQYRKAFDTTSIQYQAAIILYNIKDSIRQERKHKLENEIKYLEYMKLVLMWQDIEINFQTANRDECEKNIAEYKALAKSSKDRPFIYSRFLQDKRAERYIVQHFVDSVKNEVISEKTNSDGKFNISLKDQKYWIYANATRQISDEEEEYIWLFEYIPDSKNLFLSNDNMK